MNEIKLSLRLGAIANFVPSGSRLADIGTDHALLPVYLITNRRIYSAIAADVNAGPLAAARKTINKYECSDAVEARLSDGFASIAASEADCAVLAGMGGSLICTILEDSPAVTGSLSCLILQPQDNAAAVRGWLSDHGWAIADEALIEEAGRIYEIIKAVPDENRHDILDGFIRLTLPQEVGPVLFMRKEPLLPRRIEAIISEYRNIVCEMNKAKTPDKRKILEYELKISELAAVLDSLRR